MENKEFYINCDGIALHAKMDFPEKEQDKYPMVIIIHGLTGYMEERHIKAIAAACNHEGYATLRVDMYGHGKSEGEFRNHTVLHWVLEIIRIIDYAKELPFVSELYLTGHSQGGAAVVLAAGVKEECLKAIMPLSPAMMLKDAACNGNFPETDYDAENPKDEILLFGKFPISVNYMKIAEILPFDDAVKNFRKPVLIVHADTDELVPYQYSEKLQKDYKNAELISIPDDNHVYDKHLDMVLEAVVNFLKLQKNI